MGLVGLVGEGISDWRQYLRARLTGLSSSGHVEPPSPCIRTSQVINKDGTFRSYGSERQLVGVLITYSYNASLPLRLRRGHE